MAWVKLDDHFDDHPKVVRAGPLGMALFVAGLCYCNRNLTDGFIPVAQVPRLINLDGLYVKASGKDGSTERPDPYQIAEWLVECRLWEHAHGGYRIHDYLKYQPSREEVDQIRELRRQAGRLGGLARAKQDAKQDAKQNASNELSKTEAKVCPVPDPDPGSISLSIDPTCDSVGSTSDGGLEKNNLLTQVISHAPASPDAAMPTLGSDFVCEPEPQPPASQASEPARPKRKNKDRQFRPEAWELAREIVDDMRRSGVPVQSDDTLHFASMLNSVLRARDSPVEPEEIREAWEWAKRQDDLAPMRVWPRGFRKCIRAYKAAKLRAEQEYEARKWRL